jgi:hypothetical protein
VNYKLRSRQKPLHGKFSRVNLPAYAIWGAEHLGPSMNAAMMPLAIAKGKAQ